MAEKTEKPAKEEAAADKSRGGGNMPVVAAVMLMGLMNTGAIGGLGYFMVTKGPMAAPHAPAAGDHADAAGGEHGAAAADGEHGAAAAGDHGDAAGGDHADTGGDHPVKREKGAPPGIVQEMANIVVRLKDVEREHHARISLSLEFKSVTDKAAIEASLPRVREATIRYASDRRYDEMRGSRGLLDLKKFLNKEVRSLYGADFTELYVTEFVTQ